MSFIVALIFLPETKDRDINPHLTGVSNSTGAGGDAGPCVSLA